jgi:hypothetical protein
VTRLLVHADHRAGGRRDDLEGDLELLRNEPPVLERPSSAVDSTESCKRIPRKRSTLLEGCSADFSSICRLARRSLSVISWSSWRSLSEKSGKGGSSGVVVSGSISDKEDLVFLRLLRLVMVGLLLWLDMIVGVVDGLDEYYKSCVIEFMSTMFKFMSTMFERMMSTFELISKKFEAVRTRRLK